MQTLWNSYTILRTKTSRQEFEVWQLYHLLFWSYALYSFENFTIFFPTQTNSFFIFMKRQNNAKNYNMHTEFWQFEQWVNICSEVMPIFNLENCKACAGALVSSYSFLLYFSDKGEIIRFQSCCIPCSIPITNAI